jgi:23S rRNA maturation-related 3'-5' exoribonuclease YhaM
MNDKKERFIELLRSTERPGIEEVIYYLEKSGFFSAPASTKHHLSCEGGLMEHSMNVYDMAMALRDPIVALKPGVGERLSEKSIIIAALLHDICKANIYKKTRKLKKNDQGQWEQCDTYETDYSRMPVGHGEKSVIMLLSLGLKLNLDETVAIRWHMGAWDLAFQSYEVKSNINEASNRYPLLSLIQSADNMATHILEQ